MAKPSLTNGLQQIDMTKDLQEGEAYIVKYIDTANSKKSDLWIGVVIPEIDLPARYSSRRPKTAKPATGEWEVPVPNRVYPIYLPGKCAFQWIQKKSIFDIKKPFPKQFRGSSEPARLFRALCRASKKDGLNVSHWVNMADEEQGKRTALGKKIFAVLPQGLNDEGTSSGSEEDDNSSVSGTHLDNTSDVTVGTPSVNSHKRGGKSQSKISKFMKTGNTERKKATYMWVTSSSCSEDENPMNRNATTRSRHNANLPEGASGCSDDTLVDIYVGSGVDQKVLRIPYGQIKGSHKFRGRVQIGQDNPYIFDPSLFRLPASKFDAVHAYLTKGDFEPKLHENKSYALPVEQNTGIFGDQWLIGHKYTLEGINSPHDLNNTILALGHVYQSAKAFGLRQMESSAIRKLQVAWNAYSGTDQLLAFLAVIEASFDSNDNYTRNKFDTLNKWGVGFLADTFEYYSRYHASEFWSLLGKNSGLQRAVCHLRAERLGINPSIYLDIEKQIAEKGQRLFGHNESDEGQTVKDDHIHQPDARKGLKTIEG